MWGMEGRWGAGRGVQAFLRGIAAILYSFVESLSTDSTHRGETIHGTCDWPGLSPAGAECGAPADRRSCAHPLRTFGRY